MNRPGDDDHDDDSSGSAIGRTGSLFATQRRRLVASPATGKRRRLRAPDGDVGDNDASTTAAAVTSCPTTGSSALVPSHQERIITPGPNAAPPVLRILLWNVESFTDTQRPHHRGLTDDRMMIVHDTIEGSEADVAIILEAGDDTLGKFGPLFETSGFAFRQTSVTGPQSAGYGGETYLVGVREGLGHARWAANAARGDGGIEPGPVTTLEPVLVTTEDGYRGGCFFTLTFGAATDAATELCICALHAPSPTGRRPATRLQVIGECVRGAMERANRRPLLFCGDLNIRRSEQSELNILMTEHRLTFDGPGHNGVRVGTSLRQDVNTVMSQSTSQPYDQFWSHADDLHAVGLHADAVTVFDADFSRLGDWRAKVVDQLKTPDPEPIDVVLDNVRATRQGTSPDPDSVAELAKDALTAAQAIEAVIDANAQLSDDVMSRVRAYLEQIRFISRAITGSAAADGSTAAPKLVIATNTQLSVAREKLEEVGGYLSTVQYLLLLSDMTQVDDTAFRWVATRMFVSDHLPVLATLKLTSGRA